MKKLYALLVVLILLVVPSCFALNTASNLYPELECVHGTMDYTIHAGATLSGIAQHYRQRMAVIANVQANGITDLDRIYAGKTMIIPCSTERTATRFTNVRKTRNIASASIVRGYVHGTFVLGTTPKKTFELETTVADNSLIAPEPDADLPLTVRPFVEAPPATTVAAIALTQQEQMPLPSHSSKAKKVKGYKIVLTASDARIRGIPLNRNLDTEVFLFHSEKEKAHGPMDGEIHNLHSRAERKGENVVLLISFRQIPNRPFLIFINGLNNPIDGDYFLANCEPIQGRFPGPHMFTRAMFVGSKMFATTAMITFASGGNMPLGLVMGVGVPAMRTMAQHHVNTVRREANIELYQTIARIQPLNIAEINPQN